VDQNLPLTCTSDLDPHGLSSGGETHSISRLRQRAPSSCPKLDFSPHSRGDAPPEQNPCLSRREKNPLPFFFPPWWFFPPDVVTGGVFFFSQRGMSEVLPCFLSKKRGRASPAFLLTSSFFFLVFAVEFVVAFFLGWKKWKLSPPKEGSANSQGTPFLLNLFLPIQLPPFSFYKRWRTFSFFWALWLIFCSPYDSPRFLARRLFPFSLRG